MSVICHHEISLDGYIAGPDDSMDWAFDYGQPTSLVDETMRRFGAIIAGRRWYELAKERWEGVDGMYGGEYDGPVFVLTHSPPEGDHDPRITFVTGGIEAVLDAALKAAGDRDVGVFGSSLTIQCLDAGLLDEIVLHVAPVILGDGVRLFGEGGRRVELERLDVREAERLTDLRFRVVR
jgi:dihydrofolate reductase